MLGAQSPVPYTGINGRNESAARRPLAASHDQEKHMNRFGSLFKPLMCFVALSFVAGCGGDDVVATSPALTGVCAGAACVPLGTAANFVILSEDGITDGAAPAAPSAVTGDVGNITSSGASIVGLTCAEVTGTVFDNDGQYAGGGVADVSCRATDVARLNTAQTDAAAASANAALRLPDFTDAPPGLIFVPGVYDFTLADISMNTNITLQGSATDVWIFQITGNLSQTAATTVFLGSAKAKNVFWVVGGATTIGAGATFEGILMSTGAITLGAGATANGRLLTEAAIVLDENMVAQPIP
jgi:hypothetical protein